MKGLYTVWLLGTATLSVSTSFVRSDIGLALGGGAFLLFALLVVVFIFEKIYRTIAK